MKRRWHIRTRILVTLIGLTCAILLAVALAFNLSVRSYIRSRVSTQLDTVTQSVSEERRREQGGKKGEQHYDERPDRVIDVEYNAAVLAKDGSVAKVLHGDWAVAQQLAAEALNEGMEAGSRVEVFQSELATYAYCLQQDPVEEGNRLLIYADVTAATAFTFRVNLILLIVIGAAILISILLSGRIARAFAEPVQSLSDFARDIGDGNLEPRQEEFRDVEFNLLSDSMNRMAAGLREAEHKQETFFQNVSHELRTPLTSIRGNAEGIVCGVIEPQKAGRVILSESDKLTGMVEDILYLSRMDKGRPEDTPEPLDLRDVLSLCVSEQRLEAERRGLEFDFDFDDAPVLLPIREQDAQRLCGNLISNAIRYAKSKIRLTCRAEGDAVAVRVADDGPGIAPEDLPHIFERFYKGAGGKHGIGLSIARAVTRSCGGELTARNDGGAVFEARFPLR